MKPEKRHAWHPDRGVLCDCDHAQHFFADAPEVRLSVDAVNCDACLVLVPAPGESRDGITNDAGVLRRAVRRL